jgi:hypothetical protein
MAPSHDHQLTDLPWGRWLLFTIVPGLLPFGVRWVISYASKQLFELEFSDLLGALVGLCIFGFNEVVTPEGKLIRPMWRSIHWVFYILTFAWISLLYGVKGSASDSDRLILLGGITAGTLIIANILLMRNLQLTSLKKQ